MQITSNRTETSVTLLLDGFPVVWTPVAKDAFDLPATQVSRLLRSPGRLPQG